MKKLLFLLIFFTNNIFSYNLYKDVKIYFWNRSNTELKEVDVDVKNIIPGRRASDEKNKNPIPANSIRYIGKVYRNSNKKYFGLYIDEIDLKYKRKDSADNDDYKFNANISLGDEELERILIVTSTTDFNETSESRRNKYGNVYIYKFYRDRVRADLKRFSKQSSSKIQDSQREYITVTSDYVKIDNNQDYLTADFKVPRYSLSNALLKFKARKLKSEARD